LAPTVFEEAMLSVRFNCRLRQSQYGSDTNKQPYHNSKLSFMLVGGLQLPNITLNSWFLQSVGDNSCTALVHKDKSVAMAVIQTSLP